MSEDALTLRRSPLVGLASVVGIVTGMVTATTALQAITVFVVLSWWAWVLPWLMGPLGLALTVTSAQLSRHSAWAAWASLGLAGLMAVVNTAWMLFTLFSGLLSLAAPLCAGLALLAIPAIAIAVRPAMRVTRARKALLA